MWTGVGFYQTALIPLGDIENNCEMYFEFFHFFDIANYISCYDVEVWSFLNCNFNKWKKQMFISLFHLSVPERGTRVASVFSLVNILDMVHCLTSEDQFAFKNHKQQTVLNLNLNLWNYSATNQSVTVLILLIKTSKQIAWN